MFWSMRDHLYKVTLQDYNGLEKLNTDFQLLKQQCAMFTLCLWCFWHDCCWYATILLLLLLWLCLFVWRVCHYLVWDAWNSLRSSASLKVLILLNRPLKCKGYHVWPYEYFKVYIYSGKRNCYGSSSLYMPSVCYVSWLASRSHLKWLVFWVCIIVKYLNTCKMPNNGFLRLFPWCKLMSNCIFSRMQIQLLILMNFS